MRALRLLAASVLSTMILAPLVAAQTVIPVERFRSVELQNGGRVTVRHGATQRVTILKGNPRTTRIRVAEGQRLVIENCKPDCRHTDRMEIEVITPAIAALSVSNGGTVQSAGAFPAQAAIKAAVEQGGAVDIRSISADSVDAAVDSGGRIFTAPRATLTAAVASGGIITYWGNVSVRRTIRGGGVVTQGDPADAGKPLSEWDPTFLPVPPLPPLPPLPPILNDGR